MVLATAPDVLLLDEPLAGMGAEEAARMVELLKKLAPEHAILLVEHDMDAVFAVADPITVMVNGQVLESGPPDADPRERGGAAGVSRRRRRRRRTRRSERRDERMRCSRRASCTPTTARATSCTASTSASTAARRSG